MLRPVNISIPVGKGVDESVDPHLQRPPLGRRAENLRPELGGSLRKRAGWSSLGAGASPDATVVVADRDRALLLGTSPAQIVTRQGATALSHASPIPLSVRPHRLRAIAGFGHCAQVAHAGGLTATIVSILGDVAAHAVGSQHIEHDYVCEVAIWDAEWRPVWGPYRIPALKWLPRVEPILDKDGPAFVFFAVGTNTVTSDPLTNGVLTGSIQLYMARGYAGGPAPSPAVLAPMAPVIGDGDDRWKLYDTHSTGAEKLAYVALIQGTPGAYELLVSGVDGLASLDSASVVIGAGRDHSVSVWHDAATNAVLAHHSGANHIFYSNGALASLSSLSVPALAGVGGSSPSDVAGDDQQVPEFFSDGLGPRLNELVLTLTGTPGVPSVSGTVAPSLAHLYKPQPLAAKVLYARASLAGPWRGWASHAELYHLEQHPTYGAPRPQVDLSLLESRWGVESLGVYTFATNTGAVGGPIVMTWPCVVGQVAKKEGRLLYPMLPLTGQQNVRAERRDATDPIPKLNLPVYATISAGAGYYNDEQYLALVEVDPTAPVYSAETHEGSVLVAAGLPCMWSGEAVHPIVPRAPVLRSYGIPTGPITRQVHPVAVGVRNGSVAALPSLTNPIDYARPFRLRAVLVFTDAAGVEYRSAPSRVLDVPSGIDGAETGKFPHFLPAIDVQLEPSTLPFLGVGRALDVELYVTERRDKDGGDPDETTYTMVGRMPLQRDDDGWFVLDTMQDLAVEVGPGIPSTELFPAWQSPPHAKPLYTAAGELANLPPPTSHVTAQVAGYAFLVPAEAPYEVWSSKPLVKGRAPEWHPALITYAPPACGGVVSLAGAYDRLYLLCRAGVWELPVIGGPNALGEGSFGAAQLVYRGQGCTSHMGTVETSSGVLYLTRSGPRLLSDGGSLDIGRAVRTAIDWTAVVAATYDAEQDEVTWWTTGPDDHHPAGSVSYSLRHEAWSTSTLSSRAAAVWEGPAGTAQVLRVGDDLALAYESRSSVGRLARYTSPWLHFDDVQGFKRVWEVMVLGRLHAGEWGKIRIALEYDYVETVVDRYEWSASQIAALSKGLQLSCKPARQQVDAIRITVDEITEDTGQSGQQGPIFANDLDWTLTGVNVRVGAKTGLMKLEDGAKR